jgi:hypothetical protein
MTRCFGVPKGAAPSIPCKLASIDTAGDRRGATCRLRPDQLRREGAALREGGAGAAAASTQIANQVTALRKLANPRFRDATATWSSVDAAMGSGSGILYRQNDPSASLRSIYPGVVANQHYVPERDAQVGTTLATAAAVLKAAQAQGGTFDDERQQLYAMKSQVGTIQGHEQALELENTVDLFGANEAMTHAAGDRGPGEPRGGVLRAAG